jgi:Mg/Co/Ni transporter MgtE
VKGFSAVFSARGFFMDPAVTSNPSISSVMGIYGLVIYFIVASIVLNMT